MLLKYDDGMAAVLLLGCSWVLAGEIVRYTESKHSRSETGIPGTNVTGQWSWIDNLGERHHVWYVADTKGFRAFGDSIPNLPEPPIAPLTVGVPVIVGIPLISRQEMLPVDVPTFQPKQGTLERDIPALLVGQSPPEKGTGSNLEQEVMLAEPDASSSAPGDASMSTQVVVSKNNNDKPLHDSQPSRGIGGPSIVPNADESQKSRSTVSDKADPSTTTPTSVPDSSSSTPEDASVSIQAVVSKNNNDKQIHDFQSSRGIGELPIVPNADESQRSKSIVSDKADPSTTTPTSVPPNPAPPVFVHEQGIPDFTADHPKNLVPQEALPQHEDVALLQEPSSSSTHSAKPAPLVASENNFVDQVFNQLSTVLGSPVGTLQNPQTVRNNQDMESVLTETPDISQTEPVMVSNFVLIDRLQVPTIQKPRVGSVQLMPQPVKVKGKAPPVIMGLHTSGRPPITRHISQTGRSLTSLAPLGIHLLNRAPFQGSRKSVDSNGPVPRPIRIVGKPNLDNFYRPAQLALTTPSPFRLPRPMRDYDYEYYDYEYYDYGDYEGGIIGGSGGPSHKTKSKTIRSSSDENSKETDLSDSEEKDD